ncbi:hypothetical protein GOP47_0005985, partial [Adiantum capillus-veneris]
MAVRSLAGAFRRNVIGRPYMPLRSGMGLPVGPQQVPNEPLPEDAETVWDDGSRHPEFCLDTHDYIGKWEALAWLCGGLSIYGLVGFLAYLNDKPNKMPY